MASAWMESYVNFVFLRLIWIGRRKPECDSVYIDKFGVIFACTFCIRNHDILSERYHGFLYSPQVEASGGRSPRKKDIYV